MDSDKINILVACEESQAVCKAFRIMGHEAYSCDTKDCSGGKPEWHIKDDVLNVINDGWDMVIGFPPCTRLTNSVTWYIKKNNLWDEVEKAAEFFNLILNCNAGMVAVENPIQNRYARKFIRKYDQIIQPYQFGDDASKATCLWLRGLPPLSPTNYYPPRIVNGKKRWSNQTDGGWNKLAPSRDRGTLRSKTYIGIANAMARQWSDYVKFKSCCLTSNVA